MKFTELHSFLDILDGDTIGLCDTEFHALKAFFSATSNNINIETDDENNEVQPWKNVEAMHALQKIAIVSCFKWNTYPKAILSYHYYKMNAYYKVKSLEGAFEFRIQYLNIFVII